MRYFGTAKHRRRAGQQRHGGLAARILRNGNLAFLI